MYQRPSIDLSHPKLFNLLLKLNVCPLVLRCVQMQVRLHNALSIEFTCGVKKGGVLSEILFAFTSVFIIVSDMVFGILFHKK